MWVVLFFCISLCYQSYFFFHCSIYVNSCVLFSAAFWGGFIECVSGLHRGEHASVADETRETQNFKKQQEWSTQDRKKVISFSDKPQVAWCSTFCGASPVPLQNELAGCQLVSLPHCSDDLNTFSWLILTYLDHSQGECCSKRWRWLHQGQPLSFFCKLPLPSRCSLCDLNQGNIQGGPKEWHYCPGRSLCQAAAVNCSVVLLKNPVLTTQKRTPSQEGCHCKSFTQPASCCLTALHNLKLHRSLEA